MDLLLEKNRKTKSPSIHRYNLSFLLKGNCTIIPCDDVSLCWSFKENRSSDCTSQCMVRNPSGCNMLPYKTRAERHLGALLSKRANSLLVWLIAKKGFKRSATWGNIICVSWFFAAQCRSVSFTGNNFWWRRIRNGLDDPSLALPSFTNSRNLFRAGRLRRI